ncbi:MAG: 6-carboxytetrahydropterin synthase QueD [bacterium]
MYRLMVEEGFSSAHSISGYPGNCRRTHGHNYKVRIYLKNEELDNLGMVFDFKEIKKKLKDVILPFDHQNLNEIPPFDKTPPTSENIAFYIFENLKKVIPSLYEVRISEKDGRWAGYSILDSYSASHFYLGIKA